MSKISKAFKHVGHEIEHAANKAGHEIEKAATSDVAKEIGYVRWKGTKNSLWNL